MYIVDFDVNIFQRRQLLFLHKSSFMPFRSFLSYSMCDFYDVDDGDDC